MVRSILKSQSPPPPARRPRQPPPPLHIPFPSTLPSPHVHFPPTPTIVSSTYITHSPSIYDRAPIQVSPNSCALPERGGRVLRTGSPRSPNYPYHHDEHKGSYFHQPEDIPSPSSVPQLIRDSSSSSSESDESTELDGYTSPIPALCPIPPGAMSYLPHAGPKRRPKLNRRKTPPCHSGEMMREELEGCLGGF